MPIEQVQKLTRACENRHDHALRHGQPEQRESFTQKVFGMSWREMTLGEITDLKRGFDLPKSQRLQGDVPVYSSSGITGSNSTAAVEGPCVITGRYGTIGVSFLFGWSMLASQHSLVFHRVQRQHPRFVYYLLQTIPWQGYTTASAVPGVNRNHVNLCPVKIPDKATQDAIVEVLDSIVDKIALNNQLNDYLLAA